MESILTKVRKKDQVLAELNIYLRNLDSDEEREDVIGGIKCCLLCGDLNLPCYCHSSYDQ